MLRKYVFIAVLALVLIISMTACSEYSKNLNMVKNSEKYCDKDSDCACGRHTRTDSCFYGNKAYVEVERQCPDFCTGIGANLEIKCVENECSQVNKMQAAG